MKKIKVANLYPEILLHQPALIRIVDFITEKEKIRIENICFIITNDSWLNKLKIEYFGQDVLTDTITFNLNEAGDPIEGEAYLSIDRIKENAQKLDISFRDELANVVIHSVLHLIGYEDDTPENRKEMVKLQQFYLEAIDLNRLYRKKNVK